MRIQAVRGILQLVGIGVTAASTLTSALVAIGYPELAPPLLAIGIVSTPIFAYTYVEWGVFSRKNRENADRGRNWVGPTQVIGQLTQAAIIGATVRALEDGDDPEGAAREAATQTLRELRDGVDMDALLASGKSPFDQ